MNAVYILIKKLSELGTRHSRLGSLARLASTVSIYIVYYRDWRRSIGSVLKILFFHWCMALRPKYAELKLKGVFNVLTFGCQEEVELKW